MFFYFFLKMKTVVTSVELATVLTGRTVFAKYFSQQWSLETNYKLKAEQIKSIYELSFKRSFSCRIGFRGDSISDLTARFPLSSRGQSAVSRVTPLAPHVDGGRVSMWLLKHLLVSARTHQRNAA